MRPSYNKSKIMRNAWFILKRKMAQTFAAALRKAWGNEKRQWMQALIEGHTVTELTRTYHPELLQVPADYYGVQGKYYGD